MWLKEEDSQKAEVSRCSDLTLLNKELKTTSLVTSREQLFSERSKEKKVTGYTIYSVLPTSPSNTTKRPSSGTSYNKTVGSTGEPQ